MLKNGDVERAFHVEGTAYAGNRCRKEGSTAGHAQVFLLIETSSRQAPTVSPSKQNVPPQSLLNGNSGNSIARRIEHM